MIAHTCTQCGAAIDVAEASKALDLRCRYCGASVVLPDMADRLREREERAHQAEIEKKKLELGAQLERERMIEQRASRQAASRRSWIGWVVGIGLMVFVVGASVVASLGTGLVASLQAARIVAPAVPSVATPFATPASVVPPPVAHKPSTPSTSSASTKTSTTTATTTTSDGGITTVTDGKTTTTLRAPSAKPPKRRTR